MKHPYSSWKVFEWPHKHRCLDHGSITRLDCPCPSPRDSCCLAMSVLWQFIVRLGKHEFPALSKKDRSSKNLSTEDVQRSDGKWDSGNYIPMLCTAEMNWRGNPVTTLFMLGKHKAIKEQEFLGFCNNFILTCLKKLWLNKKTRCW